MTEKTPNTPPTAGVSTALLALIARWEHNGKREFVGGEGEDIRGGVTTAGAAMRHGGLNTLNCASELREVLGIPPRPLPQIASADVHIPCPAVALDSPEAVRRDAEKGGAK